MSFRQGQATINGRLQLGHGHLSDVKKVLGLQPGHCKLYLLKAFGLQALHLLLQVIHLLLQVNGLMQVALPPKKEKMKRSGSLKDPGARGRERRNKEQDEEGGSVKVPGEAGSAMHPPAMLVNPLLHPESGPVEPGLLNGGGVWLLHLFFTLRNFTYQVEFSTIMLYNIPEVCYSIY